MLVTVCLFVHFFNHCGSYTVLKLEAVLHETNRLIFDCFPHLRHSITPSLRFFDNTYSVAGGYEWLKESHNTKRHLCVWRQVKHWR